MPIITWDNPATITYGTPLTSSQLNAKANVAGVFTYTIGMATMLNAGNDQGLTVVFVPNDMDRYASITKSVSIDVRPAPLTIKADNKTKIIGSANPTLTATYTGFVNGDTADKLDTRVTLTTSAKQDSPVGTYPVIVSGASDANYTITFVAGNLTITDPPIRSIYVPFVMMPTDPSDQATPYVASSR